MFEQLLALPLFRGVSQSRISDIVGSKRFHFLKYTPGSGIVRAGDPCTHVIFVVSGTVEMTIGTDDGRFRISQRLKAPDVIAPDYLFGRTTEFPGDVSAVDTAGILQISKSDYVDILHTDRVFLFNYLNLVARSAQKSVDGILSVTSGSLEQRIAYWVIALTQQSSFDIELMCRHRDLYSMFGVQRSVFMSALDSMKDRGILDYGTNSIRILSRPMLEGLISLS